MDDRSIRLFPILRNDEDYTDCVSLLLVGGGTTLIDAADFDYLAPEPWKLWGGRVVAVIKTPCWTYERGDYFHRELRSISRLLLNPNHRWHVDHRNRDPLDNRRSNLRLCTPRQNAMNKGPASGKSSKYKGVTKVVGRDRWVAVGFWRGKRHHLGTFYDEVSAAIAYNKFVEKRCPDFAYLNPISASPDYPPVTGKVRKRKRASRR